jgi:hypothetical protein
MKPRNSPQCSAAMTRAQQVAMPVIGFLHAGSPEPHAHSVAAFRKGLNEAGYGHAMTLLPSMLGASLHCAPEVRNGSWLCENEN